ncbi:hypothetical protein D9611_010703 [Ephemerocybe angulata]|uniref:AB hydrolase-1 domain-containing protein n=1 Tax=Ephemerocybe angulata TaxID=980116 RepID=A0A8H5F1R7_9AGAR|nr:hypothetical protein D9611_010703 [Tulosesus angulatus]
MLSRLLSYTFQFTLASSIIGNTLGNSQISTDGLLDFTYPSTGLVGQTWYKIIGTLHRHSRPLIALHGGPGINSAYLEILSDVTNKYPNHPLIVYDQIGNGKSTHYPDTIGNTTFWTEDVFIAELRNLVHKLGLKQYDVLGQSWGGMLAARYATLRLHGLRKLIIMSGPASMKLYTEGLAVLRAQLPKEIREALDKHEAEGTTDSQEYLDAVDYFYSKHLITLNPMPEAIAEASGWIEKDPTVYFTMNGPNEFTVTGVLKNWSVIRELHKIQVPTLVTNGAQDEVTDHAIAPHISEIPNVKRVKFLNSSHMAHYEERAAFMQTIEKFLYKNH